MLCQLLPKQHTHTHIKRLADNMTLFMIMSKVTFLSIIPFLLSHYLAKAELITNETNSYSSQKLVYTGVTIILFTATFVLFYLILYYLLNQFFRRPARAGPTPMTSGSASPIRGLDPHVLRSFPVFTYSALVAHRPANDERPLECAVCLSVFEEDEPLRLLPKCDHVFHVECVDTWLATNSTCPYCRAELELQPSEPTQVPEGRVDELGDVNEVGNDVVEATQAKPEGEGRSKERKLWRWNSTGHAAIADRVGVHSGERFMLRLPEEVRHDIVTGRLNRSRSCCIVVTTVDVI